MEARVPDILTYTFMQNALLAAFLVGLAAPMVGVFLVQRRLSLIGDGMGHVALAGVAVGVVTNQAPVLTALVFAVLAAVGIELVRAHGRTSSIPTAARTANTSAVRTGAWFVTTPTATPASATWPMPSPIRDSRRWTRKTPTIGAARPTRNAARSAFCMKV